MPGATVAAAAGAFEFHGDWALRVVATRYKLEEVKHTSIERAVVRMVVTPADQVSVQALYRVRSGQQRLELKSCRTTCSSTPSRCGSTAARSASNAESRAGCSSRW